MQVDIKLTKKQKQFIDADCDEVLYGGAAGGGKSFGQIVDAFLCALKYEGIKQLILRTSFPELERSLILTAQEIIPKTLCSYNAAKHRMTFKNGSVIEFGYLSNDSAVTQYQSAEYDIIRFDELTHFSEYQYMYMQSRIRGVNNFPKQIKSSTNPGSVGHAWVKERFIDIAPPGEPVKIGGRTRVFIPAKLTDNGFLMESDPEYMKRLEALPENEKKALLYGDWDIFEGQFFPEFSRDEHVVSPFPLPKYYKRFASLDYGLDMTACLLYAVSDLGEVFVYRELYETGLTLSEAAAKIKEMCENENISYIAASPDLWNRRQDTGFSGIEIMARAGLSGLARADNRRIPGWRVLREYLRGSGGRKIRIFSTCRNLCRTLPALTFDKSGNGDASDMPHEITHAPESLRYGIMSRPQSADKKEKLRGFYTKTELEDMKKQENRIKKRG
ncbi:MAG: terminase family protein [Clostridia bacterium]|nr:terminase family protein [Clostridia bacterium]